MMDILPQELIIKICDFLDHEGLMKVYNKENSSDCYKDLIKNHVWKNITIKLLKNKRIQKFVNDKWINCFVKYDLSQSEINNDYIKYFSHCDYLDLYKCYKLETGCTQFLTNCHTVNLSNCNISNDDIKYLQKCHTVILLGCTRLKDECTEYLKNCYKVDLNECHQITDIGAKNLSNCKIVKLGQTRITRNCIKYLSNCESLDITECDIIDEDLKLLENVKSLDISYCRNITLKGIQYLKNIQVLNLEMCKSLIDEIRTIHNIAYYEYFEKYYPHIRLMRSIPLSKLEPYERDE